MVSWGTIDPRITPVDPRYFWPSRVCNECYSKAADRLREKEKARRAEEKRERIREHARLRALEGSNGYARRKYYRGTNHQTLRVQRLVCATPEWVDIDALDRIYAARDQMKLATGSPYHVDHILPLAGIDVCGLHVPWNLRIIPARENIGKGIKWIEADGVAPPDYDCVASLPQALQAA